MTEDNLVIEQLRHIRRTLDAIQETLAEHGRRLTALDLGVASLRRDQAFDASVGAEQSARIDRINRRLDWIEHRLELTDEGR